MRRSSILVEACVDTVDVALAAQADGAGRIELCENLAEGGTTPSAGMIAVALERLRVPVHAMIRPRGGDFFYTDTERRVMERDIVYAKHAGCPGVVFGALLADHSVDVEVTRSLVERARPMRVTFHKAFDLVPDFLAGVDALVACGIDSVLTSGGAVGALDGVEALAVIVEQAGDGLDVMAGGKISGDNVARIVAGSGVRAVHARAEVGRIKGIVQRLTSDLG